MGEGVKFRGSDLLGSSAGRPSAPLARKPKPNRRRLRRSSDIQLDVGTAEIEDDSLELEVGPAVIEDDDTFGLRPGEARRRSEVGRDTEEPPVPEDVGLPEPFLPGGRGPAEIEEGGLEASDAFGYGAADSINFSQALGRMVDSDGPMGELARGAINASGYLFEGKPYNVQAGEGRLAREGRDAVKREHPIAFGAGQVAGQVGAGLATGGASKGAQTVLAGGLGGASGYNETGQARDAATGTVLGAGTAGVLLNAGKLVKPIQKFLGRGGKGGPAATPSAPKPTPGGRASRHITNPQRPGARPVDPHGPTPPGGTAQAAGAPPPPVKAGASPARAPNSMELADTGQHLTQSMPRQMPRGVTRPNPTVGPPRKTMVDRSMDTRVSGAPANMERPMPTLQGEPSSLKTTLGGGPKTINEGQPAGMSMRDTLPGIPPELARTNALPPPAPSGSASIPPIPPAGRPLRPMGMGDLQKSKGWEGYLREADAVNAPQSSVPPPMQTGRPLPPRAGQGQRPAGNSVMPPTQPKTMVPHADTIPDELRHIYPDSTAPAPMSSAPPPTPTGRPPGLGGDTSGYVDLERMGQAALGVGKRVGQGLAQAPGAAARTLFGPQAPPPGSGAGELPGYEELLNDPSTTTQLAPGGPTREPGERTQALAKSLAAVLPQARQADPQTAQRIEAALTSGDSVDIAAAARLAGNVPSLRWAEYDPGRAVR